MNKEIITQPAFPLQPGYPTIVVVPVDRISFFRSLLHNQPLATVWSEGEARYHVAEQKPAKLRYVLVHEDVGEAVRSRLCKGWESRFKEVNLIAPPELNAALKECYQISDSEKSVSHTRPSGPAVRLKPLSPAKELAMLLADTKPRPTTMTIRGFVNKYAKYFRRFEERDAAAGLKTLATEWDCVNVVIHGLSLSVFQRLFFDWSRQRQRTGK